MFFHFLINHPQTTFIHASLPLSKSRVLSHLHFVPFISKLSLPKPVMSHVVILGIFRAMELLSISSKTIIKGAALVFGRLEGENVEGRYGLGMHFKIEKEFARSEMEVIYC